MTQKNINTMNEIVDRMIEGQTIAQALQSVYTTRNVCVPYDVDKINNVPVQSLKMSCRTTNALLRNRLRTLGDVINYCQQSKITDVPTLGKGSGIEIFETILNYCWAHMTKQEREEFLIDTVERNSRNLRA